MSKKKRGQVIVIYALVGVMVLSVVATSVLLGVQSNSADQNLSEAEIQELLEQQNNEQATPLPAPEVFMPEGDVTELISEDLEVGTGPEVQPGATVTAHYHGTLASNGKVFDSSYERGQPATFPLDQVIPGWQQGVPGMKVGGKRRLVIPSELAYGEQGAGEDVPPNADLVFVVEIVGIE